MRSDASNCEGDRNVFEGPARELRLVVSMDFPFIFMRLFVAYLKVGHPGSNTSISAAFINADRPAGTILSYGKDNSYGHPHSEVVQRLTKVGSKIYSTAESGDITFTTNGTTHSASVKPWYGTVVPKPIEPKLHRNQSPSLNSKTRLRFRFACNNWCSYIIPKLYSNAETLSSLELAYETVEDWERRGEGISFNPYIYNFCRVDFSAD